MGGSTARAQEGRPGRGGRVKFQRSWEHPGEAWAHREPGPRQVLSFVLHIQLPTPRIWGVSRCPPVRGKPQMLPFPIPCPPLTSSDGFVCGAFPLALKVSLVHSGRVAWRSQSGIRDQERLRSAPMAPYVISYLTLTPRLSSSVLTTQGRYEMTTDHTCEGTLRPGRVPSAKISMDTQSGSFAC